MKLIRILVVLLVVGVIAYAFFSLAPKPTTKPQTVQVIKPQQTTQSSKPPSTATTTMNMLTISICGYKLSFTASSLMSFEVRNCIAYITFEGDLKLGVGTYRLYNASSCHISGYFDVLGYGDDYIVINVKKYVVIRNCGKVAIRPGS